MTVNYTAAYNGDGINGMGAGCMNNRTVYIIGVDHLIQYKNSILPGSIFDQFRAYLLETLKKYEIETVAEEFNREYLTEVYFSDEATVESAAQSAGLRHLFCDPGDDERRRLGIPCFADIRDGVKRRHGINEKIITDRDLYIKVEAESSSESKKFWHIREEYWYGILSSHLNGNILFICGHEHVPGFSDLLHKKGVAAMVITPFWGEDVVKESLRNCL